MRSFVRTDTEHSPAQYLRVRIGQAEYGFRLLHAAIGHRLEHAAASRPAREHTHLSYHIVLFTAGENAFSFKGHHFPCRRGTLLLCSPGNRHSFAPLLPGMSQYSEITFALMTGEGRPLVQPCSQMLGAYTGLKLAPKVFPLQLSEFQTVELENLISAYLNWLETPGPLSNINAEQMVIQIFNYLVRTCFLVSDRPGSVSETLLQSREYIESNYTRKLCVDDLARRTGLSKGHYLRLFKKSFGVSPVALQRRRKIDAATILLRTSHLKISEIATRLGFEDVFYFSKTFKKLTGTTPRAYRHG